MFYEEVSIMKVCLYEQSILQVQCDTLIIAVKEGIQNEDVFTAIDKAFEGYLNTIITNTAVYTEFGKVNIIHTFGKIPAKHIILVGMGKPDQLTYDKLRKLAAISAQSAMTLAAQSLALVFPGDNNSGEKIQALVEGVILGTYNFTEYKTKKSETQPIEQLFIVCKKSSAVEKKLREAQTIAANVNFARNLVNHPSCYLTPRKMAQIAEDLAREHDLEIITLDVEQMKRLHMDALLAVAQGSSQPPRMIAMRYMGNPDSEQLVAFVGKGITFDSGGISLKPSQNMGEMKDDMAGAAAVLAAMKTVAQLKPKINILGVMPCTENMPSGSALKPGDIISSMGGKTIEIISTDAEGRLILADAITYAKQLGATQIIDLATLTGACLIALGDIASGIIANNSELTKDVLLAAQQTGEKMWELPHYEEYAELIDSDIADVKNTGGRLAGTITAGLFIQKFVGDTPWVHIDIAGTADINKATGYNQKGATGVGVRTLVRLAQNLSDGN